MWHLGNLDLLKHLDSFLPCSVSALLLLFVVLAVFARFINFSLYLLLVNVVHARFVRQEMHLRVLDLLTDCFLLLLVAIILIYWLLFALFLIVFNEFS